jgi:hypothetical protein
VSASPPPRLSVVVVVYCMAREAPRTLCSLAPGYQERVEPGEYEVVVVDNGSPQPLGEEVVTAFGPGFSYHYLAPGAATPVEAAHAGVRASRGEWLALQLDGARIASPGLLRHALDVTRVDTDAVGLTLGFHLGPDLQQRSLQQGYGPAVEDALLADIGWPAKGYRLFDVSSPHDRDDGWFGDSAESSFTVLSRRLHDEMGGLDRRFVSTGGGLTLYDLQKRLWQRASRLFWIVGEGTFHQTHGGATSGLSPGRFEAVLAELVAEYEAIRGEPWTGMPPGRRPDVLGNVSTAAARFVHHSATAGPLAAEWHETLRWLHREVRARDLEIERLHGELAARDRTVACLHVEVAQRDSTVGWLHSEVAQRDSSIASLHAELASGEPPKACTSPEAPV